MTSTDSDSVANAYGHSWRLSTGRKSIATFFCTFGVLSTLPVLALGMVAFFNELVNWPHDRGHHAGLALALTMLLLFVLALIVQCAILLGVRKDIVIINVPSMGPPTFQPPGKDQTIVIEKFQQDWWGWHPLITVEGMCGGVHVRVRASGLFRRGNEALTALQEKYGRTAKY